MIIRLLTVACLAAACTPTPRPIDPKTGERMPSNLNFAYCEKIAAEVIESGGLSNDLCPGYMPNGYPTELLG